MFCMAIYYLEMVHNKDKNCLFVCLLIGVFGRVDCNGHFAPTTCN